MALYRVARGVRKRIPILPGAPVLSPPVDAEAFVMDVTKPIAFNTGPAAGGFTPSTVINTDLTLATGQVLVEPIINAYVTMGSGSVLRGFDLRGRNFGTYPGRNSMILIPAGLPKPPVLEFGKIRPLAAMHYAMNNIVAQGPFIMRRCDVSGGTDFMKASGDQTAGEVAGNYFHGYGYHNDDGDQANGSPPYVSHNDWLQFRTGIVGFNAHGNNVEMYPDLALSVGAPSTSSLTGWGTPITAEGLVRGLEIVRNWFSGGGSAGLFQSNAAPVAGQAGISMGRVGRNRVAFDARSGRAVRYHPDFVDLVDQFTNVYDPSLPGVTEAGLDNQPLALNAGVWRS